MFYELENYWYFAFIFLGLVFLTFLWYLKKKDNQKKLFFLNNFNHKKIWNILTLKTFFISFGLSLLLIAFWRPQWGQENKTISHSGIDIVFAVDVSKSMNALDFSYGHQKISRLDATKYLIKNFVDKRKNDRLGLVEFAGESFVASPLTLDHSVFNNFLENISSDDLRKQGTNLSEALEMSLARLGIKDDIKRTKAIILFSDGDETVNEDIKNIAKMARDKKVKIYTIGIGSEKGMPIPDGVDDWGNIVYKKWHGKIVLTKLNPEPLKEVAKISGGEYFHGESISDLKKLSQELNSLPKKILEDKILSPQKEQYWYFNLFGLIFFILGFILPVNIKKINIKGLWKK